MRSGSPKPPAVGSQRGFGYLLVLFTLAAMGLTLAGAGQVWHTNAQREKELELLFIGNQFSQALGAYYTQTPGDVKQYPLRLEDLLEDKRFPMPRRYLRKLYRDPMTGSTQWGLVKAADRIVGVHSLSAGTAFKTAFEGRDAALADTSHYDQWVFSAAASEVPP
jgi:type II secretory pathway pseudopilin PulG